METSPKVICGLRFAAIALAAAAMAACVPATAQVSMQPGSAAAQSVALFSSSLSGLPDDAAAAQQGAVTDGKLHFGPNAAANPQYGGTYGGGGGPRRRPYGRPTYKDRNSNPDGSSKFAFEAGAGFDVPTGATGHYQKTGWNVSFGAGRNYSHAFGWLLQYNYQELGITNSILNALNTANPSIAPITGNTHLWSITLNPTISFTDPHSRYGAYVVGGGGFYRKMTSFSALAYCDIYGDCASQTVLHQSNNAGGVSGGFGVTWKLSDDSNAKLFAEARYTWVDNQQDYNSETTGYTLNNNNARTGYVPVVFGLRF